MFLSEKKHHGPSLSYTSETYNETYRKPVRLLYSFGNWGGNIYVLFFHAPFHLWQKKFW